jgi:tRNA pseudouridine38-40 synthase
MRIAAILEYDGANFCGWQLQDGDRTVQGAVEAALSKVADHAVRVSVAGRTDTGVHACGQVIHFDSNARRSDYEWLRGANSNLPADAAVLWVSEVEPSFHARFSATGRCYRYVILNRSVRPTFLARRVSWEHRPLDLAAMQQAAQYLVGTHDFTSFRAVQCQAKDPVRELRRLDVARQGEFVVIEAEASGFLHHMVRNIAGVLSSIGAGEQSSVWGREVLLARDRSAGGVTATADGLYLMRVQYPSQYGLPQLSATLGFSLTC